MAVNEPIPPKGEICLRYHNSLATSESLIIIIFTIDRLDYTFST